MNIPEWSSEAKQILIRCELGLDKGLIGPARHTEKPEEAVLFLAGDHLYTQPLSEYCAGISPEKISVSHKVRPGSYDHFKGFHCEVLGTVFFHGEECVAYSHDGNYWLRPLPMFLESVSVDGKEVPRFRFISPEN